MLYITNTEGEELEEYETGSKIILNIETSNATGETISINLDDKTHDFKHNGSILTNDTIKTTINSDLEKIELEVIAQQN